MNDNLVAVPFVLFNLTTQLWTTIHIVQI